MEVAPVEKSDLNRCIFQGFRRVESAESAAENQNAMFRFHGSSFAMRLLDAPFTIMGSA